MTADTESTWQQALKGKLLIILFGAQHIETTPAKFTAGNIYGLWFIVGLLNGNETDQGMVIKLTHPFLNTLQIL